jgi:hypothetical protein
MLMIEQLITIASKGVEPISEAFKEAAIKSEKELSPLQDSKGTIENTSLESLKAQNELTQLEAATSESNGVIRNVNDWSDGITSAMSSVEEYDIYKEAGLREEVIKGRECLTSENLDWDQKDSWGLTNRERAETGLSPINSNGEKYELHHVGQKNDGPLAELTSDEHRSKENYSVLHNTKIGSEIDRYAAKAVKSEHWKARAIAGGQNA